MIDIKPTIIIDSREQSPLVLTRLKSQVGSLQSGDYSVLGLEDEFSCERKSISDLCGSLTSGRERFERELHRLRGFRFARLLIIGTEEDIKAGNYRSRVNPKSVWASLCAFEVRYGVPFVFAPTPEEGALLVERWAYYYTREHFRKNEIIRKAEKKRLKE